AARVVEVAAVEPPRVVAEAAHHRLGEGGRRLLRRVDPQLEARVALAAEAGVGVRPRHSRVSKAMGELRQSPRTCTARGYNSALRDELAPARTPDRGPDLGKRAACPAAEDSVDAPGPVARPARHDVDMHVGDRLPDRGAV